MKNKNFKLVERTITKGDRLEKIYIIKKRKKFLFWEYWVDKWKNNDNHDEEFRFHEDEIELAIKVCYKLNYEYSPTIVVDKDYIDKTNALLNKVGLISKF